jgi:hypothetical protein
MPEKDAFGKDPGSAGNASVRFESRDISVPVVAGGFAAIAAMLIVSVGFLWFFYRSFFQVDPEAVLPIRPTPVSPLERNQASLQRSPASPASGQDELRAMQREALQRLNSYGWVDRSAGIAHIPIEQAMRLLVEGGQANSGPDSPPRPSAAE